MAVTIVGPSTTPSVRIVGTPLVERKRLWTDSWELDLTLEFVSAIAGCAGAEIGTCELVRRYGEVKLPFQAGFSTPPAAGTGPVDYLDHWVRVKLHTAVGSDVAWTGRIGSEVRSPFGAGDYPAGQQAFVAYEAAQYLERIAVTDSYWLVDGVIRRLEWMPAMNARDERHFLVGNMALDGSGDPLFGGTLAWSAYGAVKYLLKRYADASAVQGPGWFIAGQSDLLSDVGRTISFEASESLLSILRRIINPQYGIDFSITATEAGFAIQVFALNAFESSFAGFTMPVNSRKVEIRRSTATDVAAVKITRSAEHSVGRVRVMGARVVCCVTLYVGEEAQGRWPAALETSYKAGTGISTDDAEMHDEARRADRFRDVYQVFGLPANWNHNGGRTSPRQQIENGDLVLVNETAASPAYQNQNRTTLSWVPFRAHHDYSVDPPADNSGGGLEADILAPLAWIEDPATGRMVAVDQLGMDVAALLGDWGLMINAAPNHLLAKNHFAGAAPSNAEAQFDYRRLVLTLAFRTDQRLALTFERQGGVRPQDGTMDIIDEDAELWFACPATVFGVNDKGELQNTPGGYLVLRNDAQRLFMQMAGAIARYFYPRSRADVELNGLFPYSNLIGQILTVIEEGGDSRTIHAPITAVEYDATGKTRIRAGYAR